MPKNVGGHVTLDTPPFGEIFGVISGLSVGTRVSNLKSVSLSVLQLLAFKPQKFRGSRDLRHLPFGKNLGGDVRTVPGKTFVKFEVRRFNHFGAISI